MPAWHIPAVVYCNGGAAERAELGIAFSACAGVIVIAVTKMLRQCLLKKPEQAIAESGTN